MRKISLLILGGLLVNAGYALQSKSAVNNTTILSKISASDVTRIVVQGDRIQTVRGVKGAYTHENDNLNGEIYIQPTPLYQNHAFTILINTELGRHYTLLLTPMSVPSDTIMLVPKDVIDLKGASSDNAAPYEMTLTDLIRDMRNGNQPTGYTLKPAQTHKRYLYGNSAYIQLKTIYYGLNLTGEIWQVDNQQPYAVRLDERAFYRPGTRAVSFAAVTLAPHASTYLYRVVSHA